MYCREGTSIIRDYDRWRVIRLVFLFFSFLSVQPINLKIGGEQILSKDVVDFLYGPRTMLAKKTESLHWYQIK